jgi:hypothetical protein
MKYFKIRVNIDNKLWTNFYSFSHHFFCKDREITFVDEYVNKKVKLELRALNNGFPVYSEVPFEKKEMPFYLMRENILLIRNDFFKKDLFDIMENIELRNIFIQGDFPNHYKALSFNSVVDCIDNNNSIKREIEFFSKLVFDKSKIPYNINGFFLKNWDKYGKYISIVSESLKNILLSLDKSSKYLIFDEVIII